MGISRIRSHAASDFHATLSFSDANSRTTAFAGNLTHSNRTAPLGCSHPCLLGVTLVHTAGYVSPWQAVNISIIFVPKAQFVLNAQCSTLRPCGGEYKCCEVSGSIFCCNTTAAIHSFANKLLTGKLLIPTTNLCADRGLNS
jgi:hypothetical protein